MELNQAFEKLKKQRSLNRDCKHNSTRDAKLVAENIFNKYKKNTPIRDWKIFIAGHALKLGMPVAKIIGQKWFYGLPFYTSKQTLDPRPDSETLVEAVLERTKNNTENLEIIDLGTGTGCLICSIIKNLPNSTHGTGIDISYGAVRVARKNVKNLGLCSRIKIKQANFENMSDDARFKSYDIIISNPPYIPIGDPRVNYAAKFDPKISLYSRADGLGAFYDIERVAQVLLKPTGRIFLEIGLCQGAAVRQIFYNWKFIKAYKDLSGVERVLEFAGNLAE